MTGTCRRCTWLPSRVGRKRWSCCWPTTAHRRWRTHAAQHPCTTPLHLAAHRGQADTAAALLDGGASLEAVTRHGTTPLHAAARANRAEFVALLLARGADRLARDAEGHTPLGLATAAAQPDVAELRRATAG
ncbi:MAG: ankyrin repeat domain-containing protein [Armatimonadetes bacterium]|nr:ankyrin repeat domain-containing protein [Armatimonadota bacterium]